VNFSFKDGCYCSNLKIQIHKDVGLDKISTLLYVFQVQEIQTIIGSIFGIVTALEKQTRRVARVFMEMNIQEELEIN